MKPYKKKLFKWSDIDTIWIAYLTRFNHLNLIDTSPLQLLYKFFLYHSRILNGVFQWHNLRWILFKFLINFITGRCSHSQYHTRRCTWHRPCNFGITLCFNETTFWYVKNNSHLFSIYETFVPSGVLPEGRNKISAFRNNEW